MEKTEETNLKTGGGLRVLMLEDSDLDSQLIKNEVQKEIGEHVSLWVRGEKEFIEALRSFRPEIILADFCLPSYDGFLALEEVKKTNEDIPFIFVSGAIGEELAIEALRRGATDCVNKNHLGKLPSAMKRALAETSERRQHIQAVREIERLRYRNSLILDSAGEGILGLDTDFRLVFINRSGLGMFGYDINEMIGEKPDMIIHEGDREMLYESILAFSPDNKRKRTGTLKFDLKVRRKEGSIFPAECTVSPIYEGDLMTGYVFTIRDISERIKARKEIENGYMQLRKILFDSIHAMSIALEFRDPYTAGHQKRVADLAVAIAQEIGLAKDRINGIYLAGIVHDIGKIYVPSEILTRPSRLTELEFKIIQVHSEAGYTILKDVDYPWPIAETVYQHHERLDGSGYPRKLSGDDIIPEARIIAVADVVEAMASHRPYRPALGTEVALTEIRKGADKIFDRDIAGACATLFEKGYKFAQ